MFYRTMRYLVPAALAIYLLAEIASSCRVFWVGFHSLLDVGYGDSYVLYDVLHLEKTGQIYRDLTKPPYLAAQYSPLIYWLYSLSRFFAFTNIFLGPRLIAFATFLACLLMVAVLVKKLIPVHYVWIWGVLIAASIRSMDTWVLQLRGDFMGIFFGLASMRLLFSRPRYAALAAGLCAGFAIQVKLTLLAAAVSGFLWLLMRRRWRDAVVFALGAAVTSFGLFFFYWLREPNMLREMTMVFPGIKEYHFALLILIRVLGEVVILLSLPALPFILSKTWPLLRQWPNWTLLSMYVLTSSGLAFMAALQAGANINYYFEPLLALTPFAVLGVLQLFAWANHQSAAAVFLSGLFVLHLGISNYENFPRRTRSDYSAHAVKEANAQFVKLEKALRGYTICSLNPRIALLDPHPALMEPYLLSYLRRLGHFDPSPLMKRISAEEFDVFVATPRSEYRGVSRFGDPDLESDVSKHYQPFCQVMGDEIGLPRSRPADIQLESKLTAAGCEITNHSNLFVAQGESQ
jgi:hypothetical protein